MIAVHKSACYDDEGRLDCSCRWNAAEGMPQPVEAWVTTLELQRPLLMPPPERLFECARGHKVASTGTPDICMRSYGWLEPCLLPLEEVTE